MPDARPEMILDGSVEDATEGVTDVGVPRTAEAGVDTGAHQNADAHENGACRLEGERAHATDNPLAIHVASIAGVNYVSNPPASGPHCSLAGSYREYSATTPLPRCHWIHNLEHGAVVLLYNCPGGCPELLERLRSVVEEAPADPDCARPRLILTPDPELDVPVAAAAWGFTWKSTCLDEVARASLARFLVDHWGSRGRAPEKLVCP